MRIAIIGAGITGLTIGFYLSKKGHKVFLFEKDNFVGGLASGFKIEDWYLERFYHHIFKSDEAIQGLVKDLRLKNIWVWKDCGAPIFYKNKIYPFSSPYNLLKFSPLPFFSRLRIGLVSLYLKHNSNFHSFEDFKGEEWIKKYMGKESWDVIWGPLMKKKFSKFYSQISMSWLWARIHKRSRFLGYPKGGFQVIINKMVKEIKKKNGKVILNKEIKDLDQLRSFKKIIFTGASPLFLKIAPRLPLTYQQKLKKIKYFGAISVLLTLKKPLTDWVYWLNINETAIPFIACVQQSNFIDSSFYNNLHPVYLTSYTPANSYLFKEESGKIVDKWIKYLPKINKNFNPQWLKEYMVFKEQFSQPLLKVGDFRHIPDFETPLKNVYLVNMVQVYPWDRGVNYAVETGQKFISKHF